MGSMIINGDARHIPLGDGTVQCVVTSPPYFGLRDYALGEGAIGLENTIDLYVDHIVEVFWEVRRVLRKDGTVWLNLGDSYANNGKWGGTTGGKHVAALHGNAFVGRQKRDTGLKPKDLCMIPHRVALALQADGWWVRCDVVWNKPNGTPHPVSDRPTRTHEYLFMMSKSERYFYDADAIREDHKTDANDWPKKRGGAKTTNGADDDGWNDRFDPKYPPHQVNPLGRNRRSVWEIPTQAFAEGHFATFPEKLVSPCVLAGTSAKGACPGCASPWARVVERDPRQLQRKPAHQPGSNGTQVSSTGDRRKSPDRRLEAYLQVRRRRARPVRRFRPLRWRLWPCSQGSFSPRPPGCDAGPFGGILRHDEAGGGEISPAFFLAPAGGRHESHHASPALGDVHRGGLEDIGDEVLGDELPGADCDPRGEAACNTIRLFLDFAQDD